MSLPRCESKAPPCYSSGPLTVCAVCARSFCAEHRTTHGCAPTSASDRPESSKAGGGLDLLGIAKLPAQLEDGVARQREAAIRQLRELVQDVFRRELPDLLTQAVEPLVQKTTDHAVDRVLKDIQPDLQERLETVLDKATHHTNETIRTALDQLSRETREVIVETERRAEDFIRRNREQFLDGLRQSAKAEVDKMLIVLLIGGFSGILGLFLHHRGMSVDVYITVRLVSLVALGSGFFLTLFRFSLADGGWPSSRAAVRRLKDEPVAQTIGIVCMLLLGLIMIDHFLPK